MRLPAVFPHLHSVRIVNLVASYTRITLMVECRHRSANCPLCQRRSTHVHSHYERELTDLPWGGIPVTIRLRVRRFRCRRPECSRAVFAERVPGLTRVRSRRTDPSRAALLQIAFVLGGFPGQRLTNVLGMATSRSTLLRLLRTVPDSSVGHLRVLGIDVDLTRFGGHLEAWD
ncbi:MAG: hypothetical protein NVS2B16_36520 [Chloroflexota bacterium]